MKSSIEFLNDLSSQIDSRIGGSDQLAEEKQYLSTFAPNIIQWVTGTDYWNVPSTFQHSRQYQLLRDFFNLRCKVCNPQDIESADPWGKGREYLESEVLLEWSDADNDFKCPKCGTTYYEFLDDGMVTHYDQGLVIAGMRSGKSFFGAHMGGYIEHVLRVIASRGGRHAIPRMLGQALGETFEISFAASTAMQARDTIYAKFRSMRNNSPWMNKAVAYITNLESQQIGKTGLWKYKELDDAIIDEYLQLRINRLSSNSGGIAGKTRIFAGIDELSRLSVTESKTSAQELYRVLNQSLKTVRGAVRRMQLPQFFGIMLNVTSPISIDDAAMQLYAKASQGALKKTLYWKGPTWEFNPQFTRADFDEEYAKDAIGAERDFGVNPPAAETPLIDSPLRFWKCIDHEKKPTVTFEKLHITDKTGKHYDGAAVADCPYNFKSPLYIFGDAGETFDSFALAGGHPEYVDADHYLGMPEIRVPSEAPEGFISFADTAVRLGSEDMDPDCPMARGMLSGGSGQALSQGENLAKLITVVDWAMRIVPTKGREIYFNSILDIIKEIKKKQKIATVAFDRWNSTQLIQGIRDLGIQSNKVTLKSADFMNFIQELYGDKVQLLPPDPVDMVGLTTEGALQMGTPEELMSGESVVLVELLRLGRSSDLTRVISPKKGSVRGRGSDDLARCVIGLDRIIKDSVVSRLDSGRRRDVIKKLHASQNAFDTTLFRPGQKF
jgi:hypothetical protein